VVVIVVAAIAIRFDSVSASIEPFAPGYYNNVAGIHAANAFRGSRKEQLQMKPVNAGIENVENSEIATQLLQRRRGSYDREFRRHVEVVS